MSLEADANPEVAGCVVIGRNEGERLVRCLASLTLFGDRIVYVDSGSSDNSVPHARSMGVQVVELDMTIPFSAGRARNEGLNSLFNSFPDLEYVQFIDGDCELVTGWIESALSFLSDKADYAIVCGRRRERFPQQSFYNLLCDMEWNTPAGEAHYCGGDALMRVAPFLQVGGFNPVVIAGEEPELCVRLRAQGHRIFRLNKNMTLHDADMHHFSQWWRRNIRAGFAYAMGYALHGRSSEKHCKKQYQSNWFWGLVLPLFCACLALFVAGKWITLLPAALVILTVKVALGRKKRGGKWRVVFLYGVHCAIGKLPQMIGQLKYHWQKSWGGTLGIIEYKQPG